MKNVEDGGIVALLVVAPRLSRHLTINIRINFENGGLKSTKISINVE
jgi:hypothetical protein